MCFRVVEAAPTRLKTAHRSRLAGERLPMLLQELAPRAIEGDAREGGMKVMAEGDIERRDVLTLAPWLSLWQTLRRWDAAAATEGGWSISEESNPHKDFAKAPLDQLPAMVLAYRLKVLGWVCKGAAQAHSRGGPKEYVLHKATARPRYLEAMLRSDELFSRTRTPFSIPHLEVNGFYEALLAAADPSTVLAGKKAVYNAKLMEGKVEGAGQLGGRRKRQRPRAPSSSSSASSGAAGPNAAGDGPAASPSRGEADPAAAPAAGSAQGRPVRRLPRRRGRAREGVFEVIANPPPSSSSAGPPREEPGQAASSGAAPAPPPIESRQGDPSPPVLEGRAGPPPDVPPRNLIAGQPLQYEAWDEGARSYTRLRLRCQECDGRHKAPMLCQKKRNVGAAQTHRFGPLEPIGYLGAWAEACHNFPTQQAHVRYRPSSDAVDRRGGLPPAP